MLWKDQRRSDNVEDDRGNTAGPALAVGGGIGTLVIMVIAVLLGADPRQLLQQLPQNGPPGAGAGPGAGPQVKRPVDPAEEEAADFVKVVLATTEDVWKEQFKLMGKAYEEPKMKYFTGNVNTDGCGFASAASTSTEISPGVRVSFCVLALFSRSRNGLACTYDGVLRRRSARSVIAAGAIVSVRANISIKLLLRYLSPKFHSIRQGCEDCCTRR